jgi:HSP20 family protein
LIGCSQEPEDRRSAQPTERSYASFARSFVLPESVDRDNVTAELSKGGLKITLPKTVEAQKSQKKIEVRAAA